MIGRPPMTNPYRQLKFWNLRPRKQLGQNFLVDPNASRMIVSRSGIRAEDVVVEIGAGLGALTIPLARRVRKVYAVEKDQRLIEPLQTELQEAGLCNVEVLSQDFLRLDLPALALANSRRLAVFGNLPYNVSSQILVRLIECRKALSRAVLMFQKELAERLMAGPGTRTYGRITVMLKYCSHVEPLAVLRANQFHPSPKVDSQVLAIDFKDAFDYPLHDERLLFLVIKAAFAKRRKNLKNALSAGGLGIDSRTARLAIEAAGIDPVRRAETLTPAEFVDLSIALSCRMNGRDNPS